ncbi:hypothetical protein ACHAW6_013106 [Cyclotella cf. meneghiniana]
MDQLLGYGSSPCSSPSQCSIPARVSLSVSERQLLSTNYNCFEERTRGNVTLLTRDGNASLSQDASGHDTNDGSGHHCSKSTSYTDGKGHLPLKRGEANGNKDDPGVTGSVKRPKLDKPSITRVIIAGEHSTDDSDPKCDENGALLFERTHPHWEGRWAGHLFLPFPPLEFLDTFDDVRVNPVSSNEKKSNENESSDGDSSADSEKTEEKGALSDSRTFLPVARILIKYWAFRLKESFQESAIFDNGVTRNPNDNHREKKCNDGEEDSAAVVIIVPHIPMKADWMTRKENALPRLSDALRSKPQSNEDSSNNNQPLHISLSRPIYLPAPSVDSFLSSISQCVKTVLSGSNPKSDSKRHGRVFHLRPRDASIFTNDQQNRSFLTIPISGGSAQWVKRVLLPPINSTMRRFGQGSYYSEEGERCVLHVSVASVRGNMVKIMKDARIRYCISDEIQSSTRSISLFSCDQDVCDNDPSEMEFDSNSIPTSIPIWLDQVRCQFGKMKDVSIKF